MGPDDLFDPAHYQQVRQPLLEASTLPGWCYTDPVFYEREVRRVFQPSWHFVGREEELPEPGDYLIYDGVGGPVIVIRTPAGDIKAFYNTCRHRGTRLLNDQGSAPRIVCPYHSWVYACDGRLIRAPGMTSVSGFDPKDHGLLPVHLESWAGFLFIHYGDEPADLKDWLGDMPQFFADHRPEDLQCIRRKRFDVGCNWKLLIENALEAYHTGTVHPTTLGRQQSKPIATHGEWSCLFVHIDGKESVSVLPDSCVSLPMNPNLLGESSRGTFFTNIHPCTQFVFAPDCMWWLSVEPRGPEKCSLVLGSCFPGSSVARPDFSEQVKAYYQRWDTATPEDNAVCEAQQAGQAVQIRPGGRFSSEETLVHHLANWVLDRVLQGDASAAGSA